MKNLILSMLVAVAILAIPTTSYADADKLTGRSVMFEYVYGIEDAAKGSHGFFIRARNDDDIEGHVGAWFGGNNGANGAIGVGYVAEAEDGDFGVSLTGGGAIVFKKEYYDSRNAVTFLRAGASYYPQGAGKGDTSYEVSISRYGLFGDMDYSRGYTFMGFGYRDFETNDPVPVSDGMTQIDPPLECEEIQFGNEESVDPCYVHVYD